MVIKCGTCARPVTAAVCQSFSVNVNSEDKTHQ